MERSAHAEAIGHFSRGIELLQQLPEDKHRIQRELRLQIALATPLLLGRSAKHSELEPTYERVHELSRALDGPAEVFNAISELTVPVYVVNGGSEPAHCH